jgi:hypothetical protein
MWYLLVQYAIMQDYSILLFDVIPPDLARLDDISIENIFTFHRLENSNAHATSRAVVILF